MGKEQIEEMAKDLCDIQYKGMKCRICYGGCECHMLAEALYNAGYRKQSENTIVLPCALGTTLYFLYDNKYANKPDLTPRIYESNEWYFDVRNSGISIKPLDIHCYKGIFHYELGVNVFFTREEAKRKGGADNDRT